MRMKHPAIVAILVACTMLLLGCGGPPAESPMPDLVGMPMKEAEEALDDIGVKISTVDATGQDRSVWNRDNWSVASQEVQPGETVVKGDTVRVAILKEGERSVVTLRPPRTTDPTSTYSTAGPAETTTSRLPAVTSTPSTTTAAAAPRTTTSAVASRPTVTSIPAIVSLPMDRAEKNAGVRLNAIDLGANLVPGMSGNRSRMVLDPSNWRVVAQCETTSSGMLTVGVVKSDEWPLVAGVDVANNTYSALLSCP